MNISNINSKEPLYIKKEEFKKETAQKEKEQRNYTDNGALAFANIAKAGINMSKKINEEELYKKFASLKTEGGIKEKNWYNEEEIKQLIELCKQNPKMTYLLATQSTKDEYGEEVPRFNPTVIKIFLNKAKDDYDFLEKIVTERKNITTVKNVPRFDIHEIDSLLKLHKKNKALTEKLLDEKYIMHYFPMFAFGNNGDPEGDMMIPRFNASDIDILTDLYEENKEKVEELIDWKKAPNDKNSAPRFDVLEINRIIEERKSNTELYDKFLNETENYDGKIIPRFSANNIKATIEALNSNRELVTKLLNEKVDTEQGNKVNRFDPFDIIKLEKIYEDNKEVLDILINDSNFSMYQISKVLDNHQNNRNYNIEHIKKLCKISNKLEKIGYTNTDMGPKELKMFENLLEIGIEEKNLNTYIENEEAYNEVMRDFYSNPKSFQGVIEDENYSRNLLKATQGNYQDMLVNLLSPETMLYKTKRELLKLDIDEKEYFEIIKNFSKSTFKIAFNNPNQFLSGIPLEYTNKVDGKLPKLPPEELKNEQEKLFYFFREEAGNMLKLLKYTDKDTLNQLMDKRTDKFKEMLTSFEVITKENWNLISDLVKCTSKDKDDKALTAKEKIDIVKMVRNYQNQNIDMTSLKEMSKSGSLSLKEAKKIIEAKILETVGIKEDEIPNILEGNFNFDPEYSYHILDTNNKQDNVYENFMLGRLNHALNIRNEEEKAKEIENLIEMVQHAIDNNYDAEVIDAFENFKNMCTHYNEYTKEDLMKAYKNSLETEMKAKKHDNVLYTVVRETALNNFDNYIKDTKNPCGKANLENKKTFEKHKIDYEKWLKPELEDQTFDLNNQKLKLKMWNRKPEEDLFMGNETSCCTAIGEGLNAGATPMYLLSEAFNIVKLYDEKDNVIGMSRLFCADVKGKPSIIMDNIELNSEYKEGKISNEASIKIRNEFFKYINKYAEKITHDKNTNVYFHGFSNNVPLFDMEAEPYNIDFIGNIANDAIYINCASCTWLDPKELKDCELGLIKVPKE